jgi:transglutaminase-like putative cysteine protease
LLAHAEYVAPISTQSSLTDIHVNKDWTVVQRMEVTKRVETDQGISILGEQKISYNSAHEKVRVIKAYTLQPDGTKDMVTPDRIRTQDDQDDAGNGIYSESKVKVIIFPNVRLESKTYYLVESTIHTPDFPKQFTWTEYFSPHKQYRQAEVRFSHAAALKIHVQGKGMTGGRIYSPDKEKSNVVRYSYRYAQDQAYPVEPGMVSYTDFAPQFSASSFTSYAEVAKAYQDRAAPKARVTPEIRDLALKIIGNADSSSEKVQRLYSWVARNIRYLGIYAGSGGYVPHAASSILKARYGDCKDHATLLEALLSSIGIESSPALINSESAYELPNLPSFAVFDHVITYVPSLNLFLDSTSRMTPMGLLPSGVVGKPALVTATGQVIITPQDDVERDKTITRTKLTLNSDGSITGSTKVEQRGYFELMSRSKVYSNQRKTEKEVVDGMLSRFNESGIGKIKHPNPLDLNAVWDVEAEFTLDPVVNLPGVTALLMPVGLAQGRFQTLAGIKANDKRRYPHICGSSQHEETIELTLPDSTRVTRLPNGAKHQTTALSYESSYKIVGNSITLVRKLIANRGKSVCVQEDAIEWGQFTKVLQRDLRQQFFLE